MNQCKSDSHCGAKIAQGMPSVSGETEWTHEKDVMEGKEMQQMGKPSKDYFQDENFKSVRCK